MSLKGRINSISGDFADAIQQVSRKGRVDSLGANYGTRKVLGYVCNVHSLDDESEDEELRGTVDVQEYDFGDVYDTVEGVGHHQGVRCSAIQSNDNGVYMMPSMYSDVIIVEDPVTGEEYVLMYSHVDIIHLQSHEKIKVGVVETKEFVESYYDDDNTPDYDELEETGNSSVSEYNKDHIKHTVSSKSGNETKNTTIEQTSELVKINGGENGGLVNIDALTQKLNALENDLNNLKSAITTAAVAPNDGGATFKKSLAPWCSATITVTQKSDYEDTKVKH